MLLCSPWTNQGGQTRQVPPAVIQQVLSLQLAAVEDDRFAQEMSTKSAPSVTTAASGTAVAPTEAVSREFSKGTSEATISLEAKEVKRRGRPKKVLKKSGRSPQETDLRNRVGDESDSGGEDAGKSNM